MCGCPLETSEESIYIIYDRYLAVTLCERKAGEIKNTLTNGLCL